MLIDTVMLIYLCGVDTLPRSEGDCQRIDRRHAGHCATLACHPLHSDALRTVWCPVLRRCIEAEMSAGPATL